MSHFFDSSVLVAAFDTLDEFHERAREVFIAGSEAGGAVALHTLAETFAVLTGRRAVRAQVAYETIETNTRSLETIVLTAREYYDTMERAESLAIRGGAVYDALILACARKAKAPTIWTFNKRHFAFFAPDLADRIREP
jgi:predicted nucleic acid-binding protein